jgi:hypothetical protein
MRLAADTVETAVLKLARRFVGRQTPVLTTPFTDTSVAPATWRRSLWGERSMNEKSRLARPYLLASDFDQTLSFHDTGMVLSALLGIAGFQEKVAGLSRISLVQEGGELAYLLRHGPA